ncbi:N-acetyltransferase [Candidatus Skiveiella danica]|uniref:N-acetyltransferase n=1 Tax=Candidatus Skiveiella danica TaxID=3386177 RepID=UPI0039B83173
MPIRLRFLLDTNILIPLQDSMAVLQPALTDFVRLCNAYGHQLLYHPASIEDIQRDANAERRSRTLARLPQYTLLQEGGPCPWNTPASSVNDACDNRILWALEQNAAHALVTEDQKLHRKARDRGLGDRVYFIQSAQDWLQRLHEPADVTLPNIEEVELHTLTPQLGSAFFQTIRNDYPGFNQWFQRIAMEGRRAWVYREPGQDGVQAICIFTVQSDERITDDGKVLGGLALKLCTFKVGDAVRGRKIGELFLRAAFQFATNHQCEHIFLHANEEQQVHLTNLIEDFGFRIVGTYMRDAVFVKEHPVRPPAVQMAPFDYVRRYYPHYLDNFEVRKFIVPILPVFHDILFPDWMAPGQALPANHPQRHVGNAIKLAYLSNSNSKLPRPGDLVLFYRSHDQKAITTLGVVERYEWMGEADKIARVVSRRTVYTDAQIASMTREKTKVMLFRLIRHFENPVPLGQLMTYPRIVNGSIQSITHITDESFSRILAAANG